MVESKAQDNWKTIFEKAESTDDDVRYGAFRAARRRLQRHLEGMGIPVGHQGKVYDAVIRGVGEGKLHHELLLGLREFLWIRNGDEHDGISVPKPPRSLELIRFVKKACDGTPAASGSPNGNSGATVPKDGVLAQGRANANHLSIETQLEEARARIKVAQDKEVAANEKASLLAVRLKEAEAKCATYERSTAALESRIGDEVSKRHRLARDLTSAQLRAVHPPPPPPNNVVIIAAVALCATVLVPIMYWLITSHLAMNKPIEGRVGATDPLEQLPVIELRSEGGRSSPQQALRCGACP